MPTYEYRCKDCGEHLEVVQSFKDDTLTTCPACGGELRKVFGSIGIVFKGSGFYKTDSRGGAGTSKPAETAAKAAAGEATATASPAGSTSTGESQAASPSSGAASSDKGSSAGSSTVSTGSTGSTGKVAAAS